LKCISGNYSIAGNRGHLACFRRYLIELELELPYSGVAAHEAVPYCQSG